MGLGPAFVFAVLLASVSGSARAQHPTVEVRAGAVKSSALAEDEVANPLLRSGLGTLFAGGVRAVPTVGPVFEVALGLPLRHRSTLDLSFGWTATHLDAHDGDGVRRMQNLSAAHLTIGVRYPLFWKTDAGCGFGALHYYATGGLFENGSELAPLLECNTGVHVPLAGTRVVLRATGQAHRFRTPVLRDAGAQSGSVFRFLLQAGFELGPRR